MPLPTLQPFGRFAFVAISAHVVMGVALWWWLNQLNVEPSPGASLVWVSPADFEPSRDLPASSTKVVSEPKPRPMPEAKPAPKVEVAALNAPSPAPPPEPVPKAIPIDPEQALALMQRQKEPAPASTGPVPLPQTSPPLHLSTSPPPEPSAPKPAEEPPVPSDVSRTITLSKRQAPAASAPAAASLLNIAPFDAGSNDADNDRNKDLMKVNRAIINAFIRVWSPPAASTLGVNRRTVDMDVAVNRKGRLLTFKIVKESGNETLDMSVLAAGNQLDKIEAVLPASYPAESYEFQLHFHVE